MKIDHITNLAAACFQDVCSLDDIDDLTSLINLCDRLGIERTEIEKDLFSVLYERILMWLIGDVEDNQNYTERKEWINYRINQLLHLQGESSNLDEESIQKLVEYLTQTQAKIAGQRSTRKLGIGDMAESATTALLKNQKYRCSVCGVPLRSRAKLSTRFIEGGIEPVVSTALDHVAPYYIGGNSSNLQLLCQYCNSVKGDRLGIQEDGFVLSGNHVRPRESLRLRRRMAFWTVQRKRKCDKCNSGPTDSMLWVEKKNRNAPWTYGNLSVLCNDHATEDSWWLHKEALAKSK